MIYITQGHEKSISLETLFKSLLHLSKNELEKIILIANPASLSKTLDNLKWTYRLDETSLKIHLKKINILPFNDQSYQSTKSLELALSKVSKNDILLTLPTSKDQLLFKGGPTNGHTDYLRKYFNNTDLVMFFEGPHTCAVLITDHIPLNNVSKFISEEIIFNKISTALKSFPHFKNIYLSGINPHAGEDGLLGDEDKVIKDAVKKLQKKFKDKSFIGPLSGDTLHNYQSDNSLFVYMHHDQGLAPFKQLQLFMGANITLGLPFIRLSPDHGTAFDLYGKNKANYLGTLYCLNWALKNHERNHN